MKKVLFTLLALPFLFAFKGDDSTCVIRNKSFVAGENVTFYVFYTLAGVWVHAGNANFTVAPSTLNNKSVYHIVANGSTLPGYDWVYKIRDRYETFIDTATLQPYKFIRNVNEGNYKKFETVTFNHSTNTAITNNGVYKVPKCVQDVLSEVYLARNLDFEGRKKGDLIPFDLFLDNEVYHMYVRYLGKETIKSRYGKIRCIKFKPLLLKGSIFEGGEKMTVWVSDDGNRLPIRIESPISVGSVKVDMMMYRNLRHPFTALINVR
ncbi:MAG: DUF3108 domain-containing protein [Bacteroidetes bacterium]|nr:MAG: DUF3108 domain-containing protein [Bacteroidota bacterium]